MPSRRSERRELTATSTSLRVELREQQREIQRLRTENEILREAAEPLIHHAPARERFAFIHRLRGLFGIRRLCLWYLNIRFGAMACGSRMCQAAI